MRERYDFVIVGAGKAGVTAALTLRDRLPSSSILLINGEDRLPYKRTSLTKHLNGSFGRDDFALLSQGDYRERNLDRIDGDTVLRVNPEERTLTCRSGLTVGWGLLLLATGAVPNRLDIPGAEFIRHLRTIHEAEEIQNLLKSRPRTIVIGQGVEGVELAEQCRLAGCEVVLLGREERLMSRWLDPFLSRMMDRLLESRGVECRFGLLPRSVGRAAGSFVLDCGDEKIEADLVLSSLGIRGNPHLAEELGIYGDTGIVIDRHCRSSVPHIFAAGDAVQSEPGWPRGLWHWAEYQGENGALNMAAAAGDEDASTGPELYNRATRLKCEPFGDFFFSLSLDGTLDSDDSFVFIEDERRYLRIFERDGKSVAALMRGFGRAGGKALEQAVRSGMPAAEAARALDLRTAD
jgi:NAD(P)H-nitrite reductase large subunit